MEKDLKDILLKDLCARLPYGVKCYNMFSKEICELAAIELDIESHLFCFWDKRKMFYHQQTYISEFKPYLFPLSNMTEEQKREYDKIIYHSIELHYREYSDIVEIDLFDDLQDFYCKNHLDYRGLIEKGLALDATGLNIY